MAMEIANKISRRKHAHYVFKSAGLAVMGNQLDENVYTVLEEIGITTAHVPISIMEVDISRFDAIHVMTQRQKITVASYFKDIPDIEDKITVLGVGDPYYYGIDAYRACRDQFIEFYEGYINE